VIPEFGDYKYDFLYKIVFPNDQKGPFSY